MTGQKEVVRAKIALAGSGIREKGEEGSFADSSRDGKGMFGLQRASLLLPPTV